MVMQQNYEVISKKKLHLQITVNVVIAAKWMKEKIKY